MHSVPSAFLFTAEICCRKYCRRKRAPKRNLLCNSSSRRPLCYDDDTVVNATFDFSLIPLLSIMDLNKNLIPIYLSSIFLQSHSLPCIQLWQQQQISLSNGSQGHKSNTPIFPYFLLAPGNTFFIKWTLFRQMSRRYNKKQKVSTCSCCLPSFFILTAVCW